MPRKPAAAVPARARLSDKELLAQAALHDKARRLIKQMEDVSAECQRAMLDELALRQLDSVRIGATTLTRVQSATRTLDVMGLMGVVAATIRKRVFRSREDLNALPEAKRTELIAQLSRAERRAITSYDVVPDALKAAVAAGEIAQATVESHTRVTPKAAYVRVTDPPVEPAP
jgi:hypothetical protein